MRPTLTVLFGRFPIPALWAALLAGLLVARWGIGRAARRLGLAPDHLGPLLDGLTLSLLIGLAGARLWVGLFHWGLYSQYPGFFLALNLGDLALTGGLLAGGLTFELYRRWRRAPLGWWDVVAVGLLPGLALGRALALLDGAGFGLPTDLPWGVEILGRSRHPVQLYEGLLTLGLWLWLDRRSRTLTEGEGLRFALWGYALLRLLVDGFRADALTVGPGIRIDQVLALLVLLGVIAAWPRTLTRAEDRERTWPGGGTEARTGPRAN